MIALRLQDSSNRLLALLTCKSDGFLQFIVSCQGIRYTYTSMREVGVPPAKLSRHRTFS